jgi:hypothetical protein
MSIESKSITNMHNNHIVVLGSSDTPTLSTPLKYFSFLWYNKGVGQRSSGVYCGYGLFINSGLIFCSRKEQK